MNQKTLYVWQGDFGLASVDPDCLSLILYIRIKKIKNIEVRFMNSPMFKALPSLYYNGNIITNRDQIFHDLHKSLRSNSIQKLESKVKVYLSYVRQCLELAYMILMWHNEENFNYLTRPWHINAIPCVIYNRSYVNSKRNSVCKYLQDVADNNPFDVFVKDVLETADRCINDLSEILGNQDYFLDSIPSALDAVIFGYLAVFLKSPMPYSPLKATISSLPNLQRYITNVSDAYFSDIKDNYKYVKKANAEDETVSIKPIVFAGLFATAAMIGYAYLKGIIKIKF